MYMATLFLLLGVSPSCDKMYVWASSFIGEVRNSSHRIHIHYDISRVKKLLASQEGPCSIYYYFKKYRQSQICLYIYIYKDKLP
jgi:hypothetical protein